MVLYSREEEKEKEVFFGGVLRNKYTFPRLFLKHMFLGKYVTS